MARIMTLPLLAKIAAINWLFLAIGAVVVLTFILRPFLRSAAAKRRRAVFDQMGLHEVQRQQIFGNDSRQLARVIHDRPDSSISIWAGTGAREGEVALFEFLGEASGGSVNKWIVIGFRLPAAIPDFEICHVLLLDRLIHRFTSPPTAAPAASNTPPEERKFGPFKVHARDADRPPQHRMEVQGNPGFAENYAVWAADPDGTRRMLTAAVMAKLTATNSKTLHILSGRGWLFIYHWGEDAPPAKYPALFDEAVELFSGLNLDAGTNPTQPNP